MIDVFRRLPLLVLVVLLLLLLVVFHVCILGNIPRRACRRRSLKKDVRMEGRKVICRSAGEQGGGQRSRQSPSRSSRPSERSGYVHLPPHLQPLSDTSDEEADDRRSRTVPLGSRSTQEWATTEVCGSRDGCYGHSYTKLLQQGLSGDEGDGGVNLSFGLCSGRSSAASRTVIITPHPDDDRGQVMVVARSLKSPTPVLEASGNNRDPLRQQFQSPFVSRARRRGECGETDCGIADLGDARDGREVWAEHGRELQSGWEESITRGVQRLRVGEKENDSDATVMDVDDQEWNDNDSEGGEEDAGYISPFKQSSMGGRGGKTKACGRNGRQGEKAAGKGSNAEGDLDAEGGHHFWSADDIIALIRAKRDQDSHLQGMGHAYARMQLREWKWLNVAQRLKKVGVNRDADQCWKKWDNLMQQFKKVHHF
ncbi:hypothetical protein CBR_g584 [Chara braunii]|uniref:Myb-like domain-containing protein n=1 Tax=Chara braunii TaxID=69332 RepID=A0A388KBP4_CHABU|nr:hypothetical protein CBR_g584 [Chara braunii]|eukprot:GBG67449.1 hypothetical protein CBR_g584 [Chara braunii]